MVNIHKIIVFILLGCLVGILFARTGVEHAYVLPRLMVLLAMCSIFFRKIIWLSVLTLGICLGLMRSEPILSGHQFLASNYGQRMEVEGVVSSDPAYHKSGQYEFFVANPRLANRQIKGSIKVRAYVNDVRRGDRVQVSGKMFDGFAYWQGSMHFAQVEVLGRSGSFIEEFRSRFIANVYSVVPDPEASLGLGFLIGIRTLLPAALVSQLSATGLTHIVAVSGYNLTILVNISRRLFSRLSRFQSLAFSMLFLLGFISITGLSPSILRASIVSGASLFAWFYGKRPNAFLLLLYSSSISALINPIYVWYDVGWHLSLAAFFGILVVAPLIQERIFKDKKPNIILQILLETSCAQILTLPIVLFVFGRLSTVALLANLLVLPVVPLAMLVTFAVGISYFFSWWLGALLMWPCYIVLAYIVNIIALIAKIGSSLIDVEMSVGQVVFVYALMAVIVFVLYRRASSTSEVTSDQI